MQIVIQKKKTNDTLIKRKIYVIFILQEKYRGQN